MSKLVLRWLWAKTGGKVHNEIAADNSRANLQAEVLHLGLGVEDDSVRGA